MSGDQPLRTKLSRDKARRLLCQVEGTANSGSVDPYHIRVQIESDLERSSHDYAVASKSSSSPISDSVSFFI